MADFSDRHRHRHRYPHSHQSLGRFFENSRRQGSAANL